MKKITVNASYKYDVQIGRGLLENCGELVRAVTSASAAALISDDNVDKIYGGKVAASLEKAGFTVYRFVFPHGEASKNLKVLNDIFEFLCASHITRSDVVIALGGGVTGDMAGFAAAAYLRGVDLVQIPTSLLAQVDSSVGGKTAVDLPCGKNLVGAFKQPKTVICDIDALDTLPEDLIIDGMGEVVKYGMIKSAELFDILSANDLQSLKNVIDDIICRCVSIKRDVIEADEFDNGERMLLNFGHTLGHSIEQHYNYTGISHGRAVAEGMYEITALAEMSGKCAKGTSDKLRKCLENYRLPYRTDVKLSQLANACLNDKKRDGGNISIIICSECGRSAAVKMSVDEFVRFIGQ